MTVKTISLEIFSEGARRDGQSVTSHPPNLQRSMKKNTYVTWPTFCSRDAHPDHAIFLIRLHYF